MEEAKLFVGLGFPFEAPSPLEALQAGCYFINPIWDPPIGRSLEGSRHSKNYIKGLIHIKGFFNDKPTLRQLDSQVPYLASSKFSGKGFTDSKVQQAGTESNVASQNISYSPDAAVCRSLTKTKS